MGSFVFPNLLNVCGAHAAVALASGRTTRDPGAVGQKRLENVEKGRLAHPGTLSALSAIAPPSSACSCDRNSRVRRISPFTVSTISAPIPGTAFTSIATACSPLWSVQIASASGPRAPWALDRHAPTSQRWS
jgi:hypothetical protein